MAETVIIGAGIVGITTAYYLSEHQPAETIHLVENAEFLASASGYAAGFLARDWFGPEVKELAALSFDQHKALSAKYNGSANWGYILSTSMDYQLPGDAKEDTGRFGLDMMARGNSVPSKEGPGAYTGSFPAWVRRRERDSIELRADDDTSAQLDPLAFSRFLLNILQERGVHFHQPARVTSVNTDDDGTLASVRIEETAADGSTVKEATLPCTRLFLTAGAWTGRVFDALFGATDDSAKPTIPMSNVAGHSLLVRLPSRTPVQDHVHALFTSGGSLKFRTSLFERADGTVYLAGWNSTAIPVPARSTDSVPYPDELDGLFLAGKEIMGVSGAEGDAIEIIRPGLCHRPVTPWGFPLVLRLPDERLGAGIHTKPGAAGGVFVAAGHGAWGISQGPGTGMVLAELAQGRPLSADINQLGFH